MHRLYLGEQKRKWLGPSVNSGSSLKNWKSLNWVLDREQYASKWWSRGMECKAEFTLISQGTHQTAWKYIHSIIQVEHRRESNQNDNPIILWQILPRRHYTHIHSPQKGNPRQTKVAAVPLFCLAKVSSLGLLTGIWVHSSWREYGWLKISCIINRPTAPQAAVHESCKPGALQTACRLQSKNLSSQLSFSPINCSFLLWNLGGTLERIFQGAVLPDFWPLFISSAASSPPEFGMF